MNRRLAGAAALLALLLAACRPADRGGPVAEAPSVRVASYNVRLIGPHRTAAALADTGEVLAELRPDLVALQEVRLADLPRLGRAAGLGYHGGVPVYPDREGGVGVLSRWPVDVRALPLDGDPRRENLAHAVVDLGGIAISLYSVHLSHTGLGDTPGLGTLADELGTDTLRARQARQVLGYLEQDPYALVIVAGDLNSFPGTGAYRLLDQRLDDAFPLDESLEGTYRMPDLPDPKIDHILHDDRLRTVEARVVDAGPSDHRPVLAVLRLPDEPAVDGERLAALQRALAERGLDPGPVDGIIGPRTRGAVRRWQRLQGSPVDGLLSESLLARLAGGQAGPIVEPAPEG